jgi:hypothetical protein
MRIFPPLPGESHIQTVYTTREEKAIKNKVHRSQGILNTTYYICFRRRHSPHTIPHNIATIGLLVHARRRLKGKVSMYRVEYATFNEEHSASSKEPRFWIPLLSSCADVTIIHKCKIPARLKKDSKNKHTDSKPTYPFIWCACDS